MIEISSKHETEQSEQSRIMETPARETGVQIGEGASAGEKSAQEVSEGTFDRTIEHVTNEFGGMMSEEQLSRIESESENSKPTVMPMETYMECFPENDPSVLGHYDAEGRVFLKEGSPEIVNHVTTHEALHLTSFKELDRSKEEGEVYRSGIREVIFKENGVVETNNQALNEGITELYAIREMQLRGERTSIEAVSAYPEAQRKAYELQGIVGSRIMQRAYFGGERMLLEAEVNRLSYGDETAWNRYSHNVDVLEYGTNAEEIQQARRELTFQNAIMTAFKEEEAKSHMRSQRRPWQ